MFWPAQCPHYSRESIVQSTAHHSIICPGMIDIQLACYLNGKHDRKRELLLIVYAKGCFARPTNT